MAPFQKYSDLRQSEEELSDEGTPRGLPLPQPPRRYTASNVHIMMCLGFLACLASIAFGFFMGTYGYSLALGQSQKSPGHHEASFVTDPKKTETLGMATIDELPFVTDVPLVRKTFEHDSSYNFTAPGSNQKWLDLISFGKPFIAIEDPAKYGLPDYFHKDLLQPEGLQPVAWNVFHQLHCLVCIRTTYMKLELNMDGGYDVCTRQHIEHCLESLRQAIMCSANMNMERFEFIHYPGEDPKEMHPKLIGTHEIHTCRDWDAVKRNIEKMRSENIPVTKFGETISSPQS